MAKLLVVEDDFDQNLLTCLQLNRSGFKDIVSAYNGAEAEEKAFSERPDLVLMDVMMPDVSGLELIATMRKLLANPTLPIIALTGCTMDEELEQIRKAGFSAIVTKPVNLSDLVEKIHFHLIA